MWEAENAHDSEDIMCIGNVKHVSIIYIEFSQIFVFGSRDGVNTANAQDKVKIILPTTTTTTT